MTLHPMLAQMLSLMPAEPDYGRHTAAAARAAMQARVGMLLAMAPRPAGREDFVHDGLALRIIRPDTPGPHPVILFLHGGGWVVCSNDTHQPLAVAIANASGAAVVLVEYRLAPEHPFPAAVHDARDGLIWVRRHGAAHGLDANRIIVAGDSAGGNLAAVVAAHAHGLAGQWLIYPVTDWPDAAAYPSYVQNDVGFGLSTAAMRWYWQQYGGDGPDARPMQRADLAGQPPALVQTAQYDVLRDEGEAYAARLGAAGVPVQLTRHAGMIHGFLSMTGLLPGADAALAEGAAWVQARFQSR
ncbi:MAG: alpha/beta hydrolase [Alphaproteobacteria bacterium]|nr:alpha/beta hydrolase [Alphaproteobacteria bacterium]